MEADRSPTRVKGGGNMLVYREVTDHRITFVYQNKAETTSTVQMDLSRSTAALSSRSSCSRSCPCPCFRPCPLPLPLASTPAPDSTFAPTQGKLCIQRGCAQEVFRDSRSRAARYGGGTVEGSEHCKDCQELAQEQEQEQEQEQ